MAGIAGAVAPVHGFHWPLVWRSAHRPVLGAVGGALYSQVSAKSYIFPRTRVHYRVNYSVFYSDLFNLPLPPLWTVLLGEYNRHIESGYEQRISVDKIVMHSDYEDFQHDLGLRNAIN